MATLLLVHELDEPSPALPLARGATVLLAEAGVASTEIFDRLAALATRGSGAWSSS